MSNDRQYNGHKKNDKRTNNDLQNTTKKKKSTTTLSNMYLDKAANSSNKCLYYLHTVTSFQ